MSFLEFYFEFLRNVAEEEEAESLALVGLTPSDWLPEGIEFVQDSDGLLGSVVEEFA